MTPLPPALPGTTLRILATSDLGAATVPLRTSYGESGTCAGIVGLLERERVPAIWLDAGDLVVGNPAYPLLGERPWADVADLPIAAAAAGNHDFDDGIDALLDAARLLSFPLLCANADVGLEPAAVIDTEAGPLGVIGLTNPHGEYVPTGLTPDWRDRVGLLARELRGDGARWVVALLHDGVTWWPDGNGTIGTRSTRLEAVTRPWAADVDVILAGHDFGAWTGSLDATPAGEPHLFASSLVVVDLADGPAVRGVFRVPATRPSEPSPAAAAIDVAAERVVGELAQRWLTRTGAPHYLPDLIARGLRTTTGADAGLALPSFHGTQAPLDGAVATLGPGPVTELDVARLVVPEYDPVVVELRSGELWAAVDAHWATADPRNAAGDDVWWNWCRMPAGKSVGADEPATLAVAPGAVPHLAEWLGRDIASEPSGVTARDALIGVLA